MQLRLLCLTAPMMLAVAGLSGCNFNSYVYRPTVHQGNLVTQEMVDQLSVGMGRQQVMFLMGEPLIQNPLRRNQWDYVYYNSPRRGTESMRRLMLIFDDNDQLAKIESMDMPTELQSDHMILGRETDFVVKPVPVK